jgi:hypothetical protein
LDRYEKFEGSECVFDGSGEVAFSATESLDGRESQLFFQVIGEYYADSPHINRHHFVKHLFGA